VNTAAAELFHTTVADFEALLQQQRLAWLLESVVIDDWLNVVKDFVVAVTSSTRKWQFKTRIRICDGKMVSQYLCSIII